MPGAQSPRKYKLAVLGREGIGKTALIFQFVHERFVYVYDPTIEDTWQKECIIDDEAALLDIEDISGMEVYQPVRDVAIGEREGFLLVYSVTWRFSFDQISTLHQQILRTKKQRSFPIIIVANKCDLEHERDVSRQEGSDLAKQLGCKFFETSAKEGINVDEAFSDLVREIRKHDSKPALDRERADKDLARLSSKSIINWLLKGRTGRYDRELKKYRQETEITTHTKDDEPKAELEKEADREREEIERITRDLESMVADFDTEKSRLESAIMELETEKHRSAEELESLRDQVFQARKEAETLQIEHKRRETELLNEKKEVEERYARQVEAERNARELAEARYQEHLSELQQQILRVEAEKKWAEIEYDANVMAERKRALALDMELQRQEKMREEEEQARLLEKEQQRARLQDAIGSARQEVEKLIGEQEQREREAAFASHSQVEAQALRLEKQSQALQHEKEICLRRILEETERVRRTLEEAHSKEEQEAQACREAEEAHIRQLEEQQRLRLEEERRRLSFLEEYAHDHEENSVVGQDQLWRVRESEVLRQAREAAIAKLEEECRQSKLREEIFKRQLEEEVARVCKVMQQELAEKERRAVEVQRAARLSRALVHEVQEKARLAEEHKHRRISGGELTVLHRRVTEAEDVRRQLEHQQVLSCALAALEKLQSLYTPTEMKSLAALSPVVTQSVPHPVDSETVESRN